MMGRESLLRRDLFQFEFPVLDWEFLQIVPKCFPPVSRWGSESAQAHLEQAESLLVVNFLHVSQLK